MATTYHKGHDSLAGGFPVIQVTDDPAYTVVAVCDTEARALQIAALLTADEA